ncbi:hypothetical protein JCM25156A_07980 [Komagataeibacter kakiaceti JCM 25156]
MRVEGMVRGGTCMTGSPRCVIPHIGRALMGGYGIEGGDGMQGMILTRLHETGMFAIGHNDQNVMMRRHCP